MRINIYAGKQKPGKRESMRIYTITFRSGLVLHREYSIGGMAVIEEQRRSALAQW